MEQNHIKQHGCTVLSPQAPTSGDGRYQGVKAVTMEIRYEAEKKAERAEI
jgi:hypothetical protein